jgi:hypothetical protein
MHAYRLRGESCGGRKLNSAPAAASFSKLIASFRGVLHNSASKDQERVGALTHAIDTCLIKKGEFVTRSIAGEAIVVPVRGHVGDLDAIYNFNEVGAFIWNLIDGQTSIQTIVNAVCDVFDVPPEVAEKDIAQLLAALEGLAIIEASEKP